MPLNPRAGRVSSPWWSSHQALVPCTCRGIIGHSNASEEPFHVHYFLLSQDFIIEGEISTDMRACQCRIWAMKGLSEGCLERAKIRRDQAGRYDYSRRRT